MMMLAVPMTRYKTSTLATHRFSIMVSYPYSRSCANHRSNNYFWTIR
jgi:hypothetical protein